MRTLRLLGLHCNKTDDDDNNANNPKPNEVFLAVENGTFHIFGPELLMNKSDWNVNADIQFNEKVIISFYDKDMIRNLSTIKHFRNYIVKEEIQDGLKKVNFDTSNANYIKL